MLRPAIDHTAVPSSCFSVRRPWLPNDNGERTISLTIQVWNAWELWLQESAQEKPAQSAIALVNMKELIRRHQKPEGPLHELTAETNLDSFTYDELVTLHALGAMAIIANDTQLLAATRRMSQFHMANTQPDHTTHQPWAMAAYLPGFPKPFPWPNSNCIPCKLVLIAAVSMRALLADAALAAGMEG